VHEATPPAPATFAGGVLHPYRHVCAFVTSREEEELLLDPFVVQALQRGERVVHLVDPAEPAVPVNRLRRLGFDAGELLERHRLEVRTWTDTYLRSGRFDQEDMLEQINQLLVGRPEPRIRMVADMGWVASQPGSREDLLEFEARANFIHADHDHIVICAYNTTEFDGAFVIDVLRTHPLVVVGGMLQENPFFVPPATFLEERGLVPAG